MFFYRLARLTCSPSGFAFVHCICIMVSLSGLRRLSALSWPLLQQHGDRMLYSLRAETLTSCKLLPYFLPIMKWSIRFWDSLSKEIHVVWWILWGKTVPPMTILLSVQNYVRSSPFSLCSLMLWLPIMSSLPVLSYPTFAFKSPTVCENLQISLCCFLPSSLAKVPIRFSPLSLCGFRQVFKAPA